MIPRAYLRVAEAMTALAAAKVILRVLPFERLRPFTGAASRAAAGERPGRTRDAVEAAVGSAIRQGARRLPWHSSCLVQVVAARMMLRRRGRRSTIVFGVANNTGELRAHAWLVARGGIVCGGRGAGEFREIAAFGVSPEVPASRARQ